MLLKLKNESRLDQKNKQVLILSEYDPGLADKLFSEGESFWDSTLVFVDDLKKVEWSVRNGVFDYLYAPLEKIRFIDKRFFTILQRG